MISTTINDNNADGHRDALTTGKRPTVTGCEEANQRRSAEFVDKLGIVRKEGYALNFAEFCCLCFLPQAWQIFGATTLPYPGTLSYFIVQDCYAAMRSRHLCRCSLAFGSVVDCRPAIALLPRLMD